MSDEWPVFKLIKHNSNQCLRVARNTGIDKAKAEWLMFVDNDDWVDEKFCEIQNKTAVENNVDIDVLWYFNKRKQTN